jgi:hypothetical protein
LSSIIYPRSFAEIGTAENQWISVEISEPRWENELYRETVLIDFPSRSFENVEDLERALEHAVSAAQQRLRLTDGSTSRRKRAADDGFIDDTAQLYAAQPTAEEVVRDGMSVTKHPQSDGTFLVKYFDKSGVLRWNGIEVGRERRELDDGVRGKAPDDAAQYELIYVEKVRDKVRQVLSDVRGVIYIRVGSAAATTGGINPLDGKREVPNPNQWTKLTNFYRRSTDEWVDLYTNINHDLYFHSPAGHNLIYREPSLPTIPRSSVEIPADTARCASYFPNTDASSDSCFAPDAYPYSYSYPNSYFGLDAYPHSSFHSSHSKRVGCAKSHQ